MVPQPRRQNPQHQPLTVALRKVCRDYPAGPGILRELLQNADDAGASTVKFVLDRSKHPDSPVLVDGLSHYQGPALLVYNDALFSEKDFQSLTSLGDSKKVQEKAATGRFGLGFSSVYSWTDCPSVLSGSTLLFLDPHHSWSRAFDPPGGPDYDFPASVMDEAMANQLGCFSLINTEWDRQFNGTIIRIPLRTTLQAKWSDISTKETSTNDIQHAMESFANEMGSNGLLFLKSVQRIVLSVDHWQLDEVDIVNRHDLIEPKQRLKEILDGVMNHRDLIGGQVYHKVRLRHRSVQGEIVKTFGVLNFVGKSIPDTSIATWAALEKLFPWVAVAAPLMDHDRGDDLGRIYSVLPLPISSGFPVHIHGLFSISADRSRLQGLDDRGVEDERPESWNKFLFGKMIPRAWAALLVNICQNQEPKDIFHLWPTNTSKVHQWWHGMSRAVIDILFQNNDPVWFTELGYVSLKDGLLASETTAVREKKAFREAGLQVIYLTNQLHVEACQTLGSRSLCPQTLYEDLQKVHTVEHISGQSKLVILEYLQHEIRLANLATLEIFPFEDGIFRSLGSPPIFLHRDVFDKKLFTRQAESTIDTDEVSQVTSKWLHKRVREDQSIVRYRTPTDLRDYFLDHIASGSNDTLTLGGEKMSIINEVWEWIMQRCQGDLPLPALGSLSLVPLRDSRVRKLIPLDSSNSATWFASGKAEAVALRIIAVDPGNAPKLIAHDVLSDVALQRLLSHAEQEHSFHLQDGNKLDGFLHFLKEGRSLLQNAVSDIKESVFSILKDLYWAQTRADVEFVADALKTLCIFKEIQWPNDTNGPQMVIQSWTDLTRNVAFVGMRKLVPLPMSSKQVFLDVTNKMTCSLFEDLHLARCLDDIQILEELVIPALQDGGYENMTLNFRLGAIELLFQNYFRLSTTAQVRIPSLPVVPLERQEEDQNPSFGCPKDIVDPHQPALLSLYFDDEMILPEKYFYHRFSGVLASCGMVRRLDKRLILNRISIYKTKPFDVVASRAEKLLQIGLCPVSSWPDKFTQAVRNSMWLPAQSLDKSRSLVSSLECRDAKDELLVGRVWRVLSIQVDDSWKSILGWQDRIQVDTLISQLVRSIDASDIHSVEQILFYLGKHHANEDYAGRLSGLSFIRSTNGSFISPIQACREGSDRLMPYLYNVDLQFWDHHTAIIMQASVPQTPDLARLHKVQKVLELKGALDEADLDVAVEIAHIWASQAHKSPFNLKVPNEKGLLVDVNSLVFNDAPWVSEVDRAVAHPKLSRSIAERLKMQPISDLLRNGDLGISDIDEDEFDQREEVADGIRDTLDRYSRESTFHEYLANADDCGRASAVNFLFDETSYNTERLLTAELSSVQGPALLVHNDGVFTESDFEGLKHVGRGSKRDDPTTIGKFGRGSQTMYHWTDVPMILSGYHLLILDPLRKYLPFNYRTRQKKPGVKVKYTKLKIACGDQLAPFENLWGFDLEQDFYAGTIFRFPLRSKRTGSELLESLRCPDLMSTVQMFRACLDEARLTLLFLRNITCIDFCIRHEGKLDWRVCRGNWLESGTFSDWANVTIERKSQDKIISTSERWWRVIVDVDDVPADLQCRHKRRMKYVECGIAARVPTNEEATEPCPNRLQSKFFNCIPLKFESTLPIQVHATFLLSGDRQNIAIEETSQEAGSDWNNWLLKTKIPQVYLQFLEDLGRKIGHDVYDYFPVGPKQKQESLSDLVRTAFWEEIEFSHHRLFPVVESVQIEDAKETSTARPNRRQAPRLVELKDAEFDILDKEISRAIRPLLSNCLTNLVCPPLRLRKHLRTALQCRFVTPSRIRQVLQSKKAAQCVEKMVQRDSGSFSVLLSFIIPEIGGDFVELEGCAILPLMDGNLGTLSLIAENGKVKNTHTFFSASTECHKLFAFASSYFSQCKGNEKFVEKILESGQLNLKKFEKSHVHVMLKCKLTWTVDSTSKRWLIAFWDYMNPYPQSVESTVKVEVFDLDSIQHFPLLLCQQGGAETLKSLHYFYNNPAVLSSDDKVHMDLYADFTDLGIVDSRTFPTSSPKAERPKFNLHRFIKSIEILARISVQSVPEFVKSRLKERNIKTIRDIVKSFPRKTASSLSDVVNDLPIWPRISSEAGCLSAKEALVAETSAYVVPWMKDYHRFVDNTRPLREEKIDSVRLLKEYVLPNLPNLVNENSKRSYFQLLNAIRSDTSLKRETSKKNKTQRYIILLRGYRLAAKQDGELCLPSTLYDHSDTIFVAAFRFEAPSKFLMPEARIGLSFWQELGLRCRERGRFNGLDYLACLHALQRRLSKSTDPHLAADIQTTLYPLCVNDGSLNDLDSTTWSAVAKLYIFPVALDNGLEYRKVQTEILTSQLKTLSLKTLVQHTFAPVCWSQTPFALHEPSSFSIQKSGSKDQPSCAMVWEHLMFLAECAQSIKEAEIESFVNDLRKTYEFLHRNQRESKDTFSNPDTAMWLNVETLESNLITLDVLQSSWTSLENMILESPCDAPPLMMVHPFLGCFSSLLKEIGCKSIHYPSIAPPSGNRAEVSFAAVRDLREKDILNDVRFEAGGNEISAHKVILASRSLYCKVQFHGLWAHESRSSVKSKAIKLEDMSYATLKTMVEYCYDDHLDWAADLRIKEGDDLSVTAEKLDTLLDVLVAADRWQIPDLHLDAQRQIIAGIRFFIRPDNVKQVEKVADESNAEELRKYCLEYCIGNAEAVLLANV